MTDLSRLDADQRAVYDTLPADEQAAVRRMMDDEVAREIHDAAEALYRMVMRAGPEVASRGLLDHPTCMGQFAAAFGLALTRLEGDGRLVPTTIEAGRLLTRQTLI
jgi:hypothetical protein